MPDWNDYVRERLKLRGIRPEQELDVIDDISTQLEDAFHDAVARGLPEADAAAAAMAHITDWPELTRKITESNRLTSPLLHRLETRAGDASVGGSRLAGLFAELTQGLRSAVRPHWHRGYFAFATTTLALTIGINLIVFTVVNALWLRPLPFPEPDRLVTLPTAMYTSLREMETFVGSGNPGGVVAGQVITDDRSVLEPRIQFDQVGRDLEILSVTPQYFRVMGLAVHGRDFVADDDRLGAEAVAIISDRLWSRDFGRREDLIGSLIHAKPESIRVIGVAPPGFEGARRGEKADIWIPRSLVPRVVPMKVDWASMPMMIFARLAPGQKATEIERLLKDKHGPGATDSVSPWTLIPLKDVFGTPSSPTIVIHEENALTVVAGLAILVLLGGCATLAALVLVHYERRRLELAVRIALGASRIRLISELLHELVLVAISGAVGSVLVAVAGLQVIPSLRLPGGVNLARLELSIDWRVLGVAIAMTCLTLLTAAALPVSRFTRCGPASELIAGPATTASAGSQRLRQTLLALLVSAIIIVLVSAGLFVRAVINGFSSAPGFDLNRTVFVTVQLPYHIINPWAPSKEALNERAMRLIEAFHSVPGVESVAYGRPPIDPDGTDSMRRPVAINSLDETHELLLGRLNGSPELLRTLGVPILAGRELMVSDGGRNPLPAVVTSSLAQKLWPTDNPLGQVFVPASWRTPKLLVVGVSRDFVFGSLARPATGVVITATRDLSILGVRPQFMVRAAHPEASMERIRKVVKETLPDAPWVKVSTGRDIIAFDLGRQRLGAWFFSGFGLTALIIGVGGIFGLVAYLAESRKREFAVRLALGATSHDLVRHGMIAALVPVSIGIAMGLVFAALVSQLFISLLTGLSSLDPLTYIAVTVMVLFSATLAALLGAWRLQRIAPACALRSS